MNLGAAIPALGAKNCGGGSWIVTRISDGAPVGEFFNSRTVERINREKYRVETAAEYLGRINAELRAKRLHETHLHRTRLGLDDY